LDKYHQQQDWTGKLRQLFSQHNEHRIVVTRVVILSLLNLEDELNFRHFTLIGNLFVAGVFACYFIYLTLEKISMTWLTFVAFMWYQLQYFQNVIAGYSVPNNSVIFFTFLSLTGTYLILRKYNKWVYILTIISVTFAVFSNGNGIIVPAIIGVLFALNWQWKRAIHFGLVFIIATSAYFWGLQLSSGRASFNSQTFIFFIDFLSVSIFPASLAKSRIFGGLLILVTFILSAKRLKSVLEQPLVASVIFLLGTLSFLIGTAAVTSVMRASYNLPLAPWYKGYSLLFVISSFLLIYSELRNQTQRYLFYCFALLFSLMNFYQGIIHNISNLDAFHQTLKADRINYALNKTWAFIPIQVNNDFKYFNRLTSEHIKNGTYPEPIVPGSLQSPTFANTILIKNGTSFDPTSNTYTVSHDFKEKLGTNTFGFIRNEKSGLIIYYGFYRPLGKKTGMLKAGTIFSNKLSFGVNQKFSKTVAKPGTYQTGFVSFNESEEAKWFVCDQELQLENL
jgi:hypothetical protein